ncbi:MAG: ATP-binding protein [Deltaproteobacteria bacterium]|nr:ATP-binding protein [Deltaproteobacteria bacterium]
MSIRDKIHADRAANPDAYTSNGQYADEAEPPRATAADTAADTSNSQADKIVVLGLELYDLGRTSAGDAYAVQRGGPNIARMFRGSRDSLRSMLAREYRRKFKRTPSSSALADAIISLQGEADDSSASNDASLRVSSTGDTITIDLGTADGSVVIINPSGWRIEPRSPVLFRRTPLTGPMPLPERGGSLALLCDLLNVDAESWPLLVGWLIATFIPDIPHPIALFTGLQGTGKTTAAKMLVELVDPSAAPTRASPKDLEQWAVAAHGSWVVCIDNVSHISGWLSDALCRAVTGDAMVRRALYTDGDVSVMSFKRCIALTSIDAGALRGDLGERLVMIDLEPIPETKRRADAELQRLYRERRPLILGALFDLLAATLAARPSIRIDKLPRMADFALLLAAMDKATGTDPLADPSSAFNLFNKQSGRVAADVVENDPFADAILTMMQGVQEWEGTASELHHKLTPLKPPHGWPADAARIGGRIKRITPAMAAVGVVITWSRPGGHRLLTITKTEGNA